MKDGRNVSSTAATNQKIEIKQNEWTEMEWNGVSQPVNQLGSQSVSQSFNPLTHARTPLKVWPESLRESERGRERDRDAFSGSSIVKLNAI